VKNLFLNKKRFFATLRMTNNTELRLFDLAGQLLSYEYSEELRSEVVFLKKLTEQRDIKVASFPAV
jgi:hypothetical protein